MLRIFVIVWCFFGSYTSGEGTLEEKKIILMLLGEKKNDDSKVKRRESETSNNLISVGRAKPLPPTPPPPRVHAFVYEIFRFLVVKLNKNFREYCQNKSATELWQTLRKKKMIVWAISLSSIQKFTMYLKSWYSNHCMSSAFFFYFYFYWWNQRNKIVVEIRSHATQIFSWPDQYVYYAILYKNVTDAIINTAFNFIFGEN